MECQASLGQQQRKPKSKGQRGQEKGLERTSCSLHNPSSRAESPLLCLRERAIRLFCGSGEKRPAGEADQGQRVGPTMVQPGGKWEVPWAGESGVRQVPGGK